MIRVIFIMLVLFLITSCDDEPDFQSIKISCPTIIDKDILDEIERTQLCTYLNIYLFKNRYYSTCTCCVCNKAGTPFDCEGEPLCPGDNPTCIERFYDGAEFLFSVALWLSETAFWSMNWLNHMPGETFPTSSLFKMTTTPPEVLGHHYSLHKILLKFHLRQ